MTEAARWLHPLAQRWEAVMAYKDLLVQLDDSKGCAKRVDAAIRLAGQHGAYLTGLYPIAIETVVQYDVEDIEDPH